MSAEQLVRPVDVLTHPEQEQVSGRLVAVLDAELRRLGKSDVAGLYLLVAFLWGWARRCRWKTSTLTNYACLAWQRTKHAHNEQQGI